MNVRESLPIVLPLVVIQLGLVIYCLIDLAKSERHVKYLPKPAWALVTILGGLLGPIIYLTAGREEA